MLESTLRSIERAIATSQIGTPVSVRAIVHVATDSKDIPPLLARLIGVAGKWLSAPISSLFAHGSLEAGQMTSLVRFANGTSCLVSAGSVKDQVQFAEITVFGNHGVVSAGNNEILAKWNDQLLPAPTAEEKAIAQLVRQSIQTRQAVEAGHTAAAAQQAAAGSGSSTTTASFDIWHRETRLPVKPPFGVLLVAGDHTHQVMYAQSFAEDARCSIVGLTDEVSISDRRRQLNQRYADRMGIRYLPNVSESVTRPDVHIVSICAEPERRARIILEAARARRHLYLDKPLCKSLDEAREIVQTVRQNKVLAHMFTQILWAPSQQLRKTLQSEELGEIQAVHCDLTFAKGHSGGASLGKPRVESPTPADFELPDGKRELTNIGVYCLAQLLAILQKKVRRVYASTGNYFFKEHQSRDVEDFGQILMELDGGITASVTAGRTGWQSHPAAGLNRVFVLGSNGMVMLDGQRPRAEISSDRQSWQPPPRDPEDPMAMWVALPDSSYQASPKQAWMTASTAAIASDTAHFLDCLEQGRDTELTIEIAAAATQALLAAYRSAATGDVVVV